MRTAEVPSAAAPSAGDVVKIPKLSAHRDSEATMAQTQPGLEVVEVIRAPECIEGVSAFRAPAIRL